MYHIMVRFDHDFAMKSRLGRLQLVGAVVGALHAVATAQLLQQVTVGDGRVWRATQRHQLRDRHAERPAETQSVTSSETVTPNYQLKHKASPAATPARQTIS